MRDGYESRQSYTNSFGETFTDVVVEYRNGEKARLHVPYLSRERDALCDALALGNSNLVNHLRYNTERV